MATDTLIYLSCTIVCLVLALQITHYWWRQNRDDTILYWMVSAWVLTVADAVFAAQSLLPHGLGRVLPTVMVSVGHCVLLLGAQHAAGMNLRYKLLAALVGVQVCGLVAFQFLTHTGNWRMVFDGLFWSGFCLASFACLRRASRFYWDSVNSPATVFLCQGIYHILRMAAATLFQYLGWLQASNILHFVSNIEVLLFAGSLFVSLLLAQLQLHKEQLTSTQVEVKTLSGLLPVCSWCKKVRDDDGYWKEIAEYFGRHSDIHITHGICASCAAEMAKRNIKAP